MDKKRFIVILTIIIMFVIAIIISFFYYDDKLSVSFETGTNDGILTKYVSKGTKVSKPVTPVKDGYIFIEWQLNGKTYDFNTEVNENIILNAKWLKEEYIVINFNTDSPNTIDSKKILKGTKVENLPTPIKDGYEFVGWYLNNKIYNSEELNSNITLIAKYKNDTIDPTYNIGDNVLIIGEYSFSAYADYAHNTKAVGWNRQILYIIEDSKYPYAVGDHTGVTGYFKASSIKK